MKRDERDQFSVVVIEKGRIIRKQMLGDPFVHVIIQTRGWRNILAVLLGRYWIDVSIGGTSAAYRVVDGGDYGSPREILLRRQGWNPHSETEPFYCGRCEMHTGVYYEPCSLIMPDDGSWDSGSAVFCEGCDAQLGFAWRDEQDRFWFRSDLKPSEDDEERD